MLYQALKKTILLALVLLPLHLLAVEGMWLPSLIHKNIEEMQAMGLQLSATDLYSEEGASLKDAIVRFGRGCTGAFISSSGLLLTNHHCGYGQIQAHSSLENDYLTHGFWAASAEEELPNPGLTVTLLVRMEDVSQQVLAVLREGMNEAERADAVRRVSRDIVNNAREGGKYEATVNPFYYGNEYYLFVYAVYRDVRMVGAPPSSVGKFGGDVDNWMWPRHSGDFMLFRVYADAGNNPADYSPDNVPYTPAHFFPVSNRTLAENDFTMVYGFPGRTMRYLTSDAVEFIMERENPMGIDLRTRILQIYDQEMSRSDQVRIQYASKHARVANAWKKWIGENRGLNRLDAINVKRSQEQDFNLWATTTPEGAAYAELMEAFGNTHSLWHPYRFASRLHDEAGRSIEIYRFAEQFIRLINMAVQANPDPEVMQAEIHRLRQLTENHFKDYHAETDRQVMAAMTRQYLLLSEPGFVPPVLEVANRRYQGDMDRYATDVFNRSVFASRDKTMELLDNFRPRDARRLAKDPAWQFTTGLNGFMAEQVQQPLRAHQSSLDSLYRLYTAALKKMQPDYNFFPDANSTLRITYGRVEGSFPRDAIRFETFSTAAGILEKAAQTEIEDYRISDKLNNLLQEKSYGQFATDQHQLVVNFIASNHTTGGNSGSPVLDANGNLIGLNFDRSWESTMSDIMFDPEQCRNISVNSQYILWVIARYAGMEYLLDEMVVVEEREKGEGKPETGEVGLSL
ncbi:MAG: S46 family peptidase [Bacteroidales bacterium]